MASLKDQTSKLGFPKIDGKDAVGGRDAPALYFGSTKMNNNFCFWRGQQSVGLFQERLLMALSGHPTCTDECPLLRAKRTVTNRCLPNLDL